MFRQAAAVTVFLLLILTITFWLPQFLKIRSGVSSKPNASITIPLSDPSSWSSKSGQIWSPDLSLKSGKYLLTFNAKTTGDNASGNVFFVGHLPTNTSDLTFTSMQFPLTSHWTPVNFPFTVTSDIQNYRFLFILSLNPVQNPMILEKMLLQKLSS